MFKRLFISLFLLIASTSTANAAAGYKINYRVEDVLQKYDDHLEIYWNVTGDDWNVDIPMPSVSFTSEFANITGAACFTGVVGTKNSNCEVGYEKSALIASSKTNSGLNKDFTIVAVISKTNLLNFPNSFQKDIKLIKDNFGYLIALLPLIYMLFSWYKKGRDITFGDKFYYGETKDLKITSIFVREHMPTVYAPIQGLAPAQIGTIIDEKVDIKDIVAEIVELARLKYIKITSQPKKRFKNQDYKLEKLQNADDKLLGYQRHLLNSLFPVGSGNEIFTSKFKKIKFYKYLDELKKKIYKSVTKDKYFDGNPNKVRLTWSFKVIVMFVTSLFVIYRLQLSGNYITYVLLAISFPITVAIASQMPRKTAKGYALYMQIKGLKNYLKIGKWRHEIYEKNLFLEEMIPLAISLGVIKKLTSHMSASGGKSFTSISYLSSSKGLFNLSAFEKAISKSILAGSSKSGSGFSRGSSGGGFGGGGSW